MLANRLAGTALAVANIRVELSAAGRFSARFRNRTIWPVPPSALGRVRGLSMRLPRHAASPRRDW